MIIISRQVRSGFQRYLGRFAVVFEHRVLSIGFDYSMVLVCFGSNQYSKKMHRRVSIMTAKQEHEINNTQPAQWTEVCWITSLVPGPISSPNLSASTLLKQPKSWTQIGIQRLRRCVARHPTDSGSTAATPFARKSHIQSCISLWILHFLHATRSLASE